MIFHLIRRLPSLQRCLIAEPMPDSVFSANTSYPMRNEILGIFRGLWIQKAKHITSSIADKYYSRHTIYCPKMI